MARRICVCSCYFSTLQPAFVCNADTTTKRVVTMQPVGCCRNGDGNRRCLRLGILSQLLGLWQEFELWRINSKFNPPMAKFHTLVQQFQIQAAWAIHCSLARQLWILSALGKNIALWQEYPGCKLPRKTSEDLEEEIGILASFEPALERA